MECLAFLSETLRITNSSCSYLLLRWKALLAHHSAHLTSPSSCVFEAQATAGGPFKISYVTSNDDGSTWSARADVYAPSGVSTGAPQVILVGSTLVVSYMTGNGPQGVDGQSFEVVISTDMGQTWGGRALVSSGAHWPGLYALDSTTFLAMYRQDGAGALVTKRMVLSVVAASV